MKLEQHTFLIKLKSTNTKNNAKYLINSDILIYKLFFYNQHSAITYYNILAYHFLMIFEPAIN